jgi:ubiquinone/menaquinone biosynthesis C-methylase UbiE
LKIRSGESVLDLGCGQGVFARTLEFGVKYVGLDLAEGLINLAKNYTYTCSAQFFVADVTKPLVINELQGLKVDYAISILAMQNVESFEMVVGNSTKSLKVGGKFLIVLNHPAFRIPKHSSWEDDSSREIQYRRVDRYMSSLKIPIDMAPGELKSKIQNQKSNELKASAREISQTWSFHNPIQYYVNALIKYGFVVTGFEELCSDKVSQGSAARSENSAREEFPLFLVIVAQKS